MTDYGSNFDLVGQKHAFDTPMHKMFAELESKKQSDFPTFEAYNLWHQSIVSKYAACFNQSARVQFINQKATNQN